MKLTKLFNVSSACFEQAFQRVVCAMRSFGSTSDECINHARPKGEHTRLSAYGQFSKRDRHSMPTKSRALTNYNAARVKRLTMRADLQSSCFSVPNTVNEIPLNRFVDGICSNCLFSYYCNDKDKCCDLSVIHF